MGGAGYLDLINYGLICNYRYVTDKKVCHSMQYIDFTIAFLHNVAVLYTHSKSVCSLFGREHLKYSECKVNLSISLLC